MTFRRRRILNLTITLLLAALLVLILWVRGLKMRTTAFTSGWLLLAMIVFLAAYTVRKKFPYLPLGRSSTWLQLHVYAGLLAIVIFIVHACHTPDAGFKFPHGPFSAILWGLYVLTTLSGIFGLFISRGFPDRITDRGEEVLFERIPIFLRRLREQAEALVLRAVGETDSRTLPDFYVRRLAGFFYKPRHYWFHLVQSRRPIRNLATELGSLGRYLNEPERQIARELSGLINKKDELDHAWALEGTLKGWLFVHIALTCALLAFCAVHVLLVYAFTEGVR